MAKQICMYFQVHQPYRLGRYRLFDIGTGKGYFDETRNREILRKVADKCYRPANRLLLELIRGSQGRFRVAFSLSGVLIEQLAEGVPDVLADFQRLADSGGVELLGETYAHTLAAVSHPEEFTAQVGRHRRAIREYFGQTPRVFRNTELIYSDELAPRIAALGFDAALVEGADRVLAWRSPNFTYEAATAPRLKLLPRNYRLSDDVGFRFSERSWSGWPLTADTYARWIADSPGDCVNLFMDYETFGEHQWAETGIFDFLRRLPEAAENLGLRFVNPSTLAAAPSRGPLSFPTPTSWADIERDLSAWLGNGLQRAADERLYRLRPKIAAARDRAITRDWLRLMTSDHFYYMCTKWFADGDVHKYFNPYDSPYEAFITYMNVIQDLELRVAAHLPIHVIPRSTWAARPRIPADAHLPRQPERRIARPAAMPPGALAPGGH